MALIRKFLSKQTVPDRAWAATLIGMNQKRIGIGYLRMLAKDPHPRVRAASMWALGAIGSRIGIPILLTGYRDPESEVHNAAVRSLEVIAKKHLLKIPNKKAH